jgi:hypothetical protein
MPDVNNPTAASAAANRRDAIGTLLWTAIAVLAIPWMLPRQKGSQIFPDFFEGATTTVA